VGVLGMPGMTAYTGLLDIGNPQPGETVVVAAPPPTAHLLTDKEIDDTPVLAALALRLPPGMRLVAARWSDGVTLLTAAASAAPDPPLSWLMEKRVRLSRRA